MKIYINQASENWVIDRLRNEWYEFNKLTFTKISFFADIIWIMSPWTFNKFYFQLYKNKKIIYSIYHIDKNEEVDIANKIKEIDKYVTFYHTISKKTQLQLSKLTNKKIYYIPFWINPEIWFEIKDKVKIKKKYGLNLSNYYVGSFQRDSLKNDSTKPKLIKGPDIFLENVKELSKVKPNLEVLLTGRKRDYLITKLKNEKIPYKYFEMVNQSQLNELYNCLDLYIISSRIEGGPQAIPECGLTKTPLVSTDVGMAKDFLNPISIYEPGTFLEAKPDLNYLTRKVHELKIPNGFYKFHTMFNNVK